MTTNRTKRNLEQSRKVELIEEEYDKLKSDNVKVTYKSLGEKYGVFPKTVSNILRDRTDILAFNEESPGAAKTRTKLYKRNMRAVGDALMEWFRAQRDQ
ncbi:hypothetical protein BGX29_003634, partial [Mortierella sp. GBA35]